MSESRRIRIQAEMAGKVAHGRALGGDWSVESWLRYPFVALDGDDLRWDAWPDDVPPDFDHCVAPDPRLLQWFLDLDTDSGPAIERFATRFGTLYGYEQGGHWSEAMDGPIGVAGIGDTPTDALPEIEIGTGSEPLAHWRAWQQVLLAASDLIVRSFGGNVPRSIEETERMLEGWHATVGSDRTSEPLSTERARDRSEIVLELVSVLNDIADQTTSSMGVVTVPSASRDDDANVLSLRLVRWPTNFRAFLAFQILGLAAERADWVGFCNGCGEIGDN